MVASLVVLACASLALGHVQINFPMGEWDFTEEQQEAGVFCGNGTRYAAAAWGAKDSFISLSGDAGDKFSVKWQSSNSTTDPAKVDSADSFTVTLLAEGTFPESGNFCFNVTVPGAATAEAGTQGTVYVEVAGDVKLSSCADVAIIPDLSSGDIILKDEKLKDRIDEDTGKPVTMRDFYCSNTTVLAFECSCHCHGVREHCEGNCTPDDSAKAKAKCEAANAGSGTGGGDAPAPTETDGNSALGMAAHWGAAFLASAFAAVSVL